MPMQEFYAALFFGLLFFLPGNSLLAQETITSTGNNIDFSGSGFKTIGKTTLSSELIIKE